MSAGRGISESEVRIALEHAAQESAVRPERVVVTALQEAEGSGRRHVLRVFIDIDREPPVIVTAYRLSKIRKYWSQS